MTKFIPCGHVDPNTGLVCNREAGHPGQHARLMFSDGRHDNRWWHSKSSAFDAGKRYRRDGFQQFGLDNPPFFSTDPESQESLAAQWIAGWKEG